MAIAIPIAASLHMGWIEAGLGVPEQGQQWNPCDYPSAGAEHEDTEPTLPCHQPGAFLTQLLQAAWLLFLYWL